MRKLNSSINAEIAYVLDQKSLELLRTQIGTDFNLNKFTAMMGKIYYDETEFRDELKRNLEDYEIAGIESSVLKRAQLHVVRAVEEQYRDFLFTRSGSKDYDFVEWPAESDNSLQDAIVELQDYFSVIRGVGCYSFYSGHNWITAKMMKTKRLDNRGRPIYKIWGNIYDVQNIEANWFAFAINKDLMISANPCSVVYGEHEASQRNFVSFLRQCVTEAKPVSWAFGIKRKEEDFNNLDFQVRFIWGLASVNSRLLQEKNTKGRGLWGRVIQLLTKRWTSL